MSILNFFLPLSLLLLPFVVIPGMYNPYEFPKFIFLLIGIQLFIVARALYCLRTKTPLFRFDRISFLVIALLFLLFLANTFGLDPRISFLGSMYRHQGFLLWVSLGLFFLLLYAFPLSEKKLLFQRFAKYAAVFLFLLCCLAILDGIRFFLFHEYSVALLNGRIVATLGNPNFLAGYVMMLLPIALFGTTLFKKISNPIRVFLQTTLLVSVTTTLLLTDSKSALLTLIIMTLFFLSTQMSLRATRSNLKTLIPLKPVVLLPLLASLAFGGVLFISHTIRFSPWDNRGIIWSYGLQSIMQHPLMGIGQENYELIVDPAKHIPIDNAHNIFLELSVAGGIPTLLIFCYLLFLVFKQTSYSIRLSLIAFLITAFFNPLSIPTLATFWFLLALTSSE